MNVSNKLIPSFSEPKSQLIFVACLVLVVFVAVLLFVNLILNGIIFSNFWPSLGLALVVLMMSIMIVKRVFLNVPKKGLLVVISIVASICSIGVAPVFFTQRIQHALTYANFYFVQDAYLQQVAMVKRTDDPRFITFRWNSFNKQILIFDESDELDNKDGIKSRDWWNRAKEKEHELAVCDWSSMKIAEHFYRVSFYCESPYSGSPIPPP